MIILLFNILKALFFKLTNKSELFRDLFWEPRGKRKFAKMILLGLCGFVYGLLLLTFIQYSFKINLSPSQSFVLHVSVAIFFAIFCSLSLHFRCILLLSILEGCGKAGRIIVKVSVIFLILTGSISNIVENSKEIARVFSCSTFLTYNLTKTKFDLMFKPFFHAFSKVDLNEVQMNLQQITTVISPIIREVEGDLALKRFVSVFISSYASRKNNFQPKPKSEWKFFRTPLIKLQTQAEKSL